MWEVGIVGKLFGGGATSEQAFWEWFARNSEELWRVTTGQERICNELLSRMRRIDKNLTFAFGREENHRREFVVSADGAKSAFPAVRKLVDAAPDLGGWKVVAFRPPGECDGLEIQMPWGKLEVDDMWFHAEPHGALVTLTLYVRDLTRENERQLAPAAFLMLDHALGEYDVEMKLGRIDLQPLPIDPVALRLKPFRELQETVRAITSH